MQRTLKQELIKWKEQHMPLLVRGARQVGKTFLIEEFGHQYFDNVVTINFEIHKNLFSAFESLSPPQIINTIALLTGQTITPGKTLLFLDEIQECPAAIQSLRYFKEQMPELHVIGAGSLLEFTLNDTQFRMPVGRVQFLYLKPLSFIEYLNAIGQAQFVDYLAGVSLKTKIELSVHEQLLKLVKQYFILGGMPSVLQSFIDGQDLLQCQVIQSALLESFRNDFGKYATGAKHRYLQRLFEKAPGLIAQHFKYVNIDPHIQSREIKPVVDDLRDAGLIHQCFCTNASGLPFYSTANEKKFKLFFLDIGLVQNISELSGDLLMEDNLLLINRGAIAEQFVAQELLAYAKPYQHSSLFYWERNAPSSTAEVDFVINVDGQIIPIEVKAGKTGKLKSLHLFLKEKKGEVGIQLSQAPLHYSDKILSIPL